MRTADTWPFAVAFCGLASLAAADPFRITLAEALQRVEAAPAMLAVDLETRRAQAEVSAAGVWPNPEASLSRERVAGSTDAFATLGIPLPLWGRLSLERSAARTTARAVETRAGQRRLELRALLREQFFELVAAQEQQAALEEGLGRVEELVRAVRAREAEGESSGFDRRRSERERAEVEADAAEARARRGRARALLAGLVGLPAESLMAEGRLAADVPLPSLEEARARATARADVLALDTAAASQDLLARAASRRAIPEPALTAGWKRTEAAGGTEDGSVLGLGVALPLFDRGRGQHAVAVAEGAVLRAQRDALRRDAVASAEAALAEAQARRDAAAAYEQAPGAEELVQIARAAYDAGEMRLLELLDAYRTAIAVRLRLIDLSLEARRAEVELDRATGFESIR